MTEKIILDTDIGTDADDAIALVYAIRSGLDLKLVTTVHGDTVLRASIAKKICDLLGIDIPVVAGEQYPLKQKQLFWTGLEGKGFVAHKDQNSPTQGVEAIIDTVNAYKHECSIVAIGPLTNIARAFEKDASIPGKINNLYLMGNAIIRQTEYLLNYRAHNFKVDPEAVDIVMKTDLPTTIVTTEVCKQSHLTRQEIQSLARSSHQLRVYIAKSALAWMDYIKYETAFLYDPLVVQHVLDGNCTHKQQFGKTHITTGCRYDIKPLVLKTLQELG